ncbi:hypothetical protein G7Y79_00020g048550 [Physcia stellaris]|nr:hypothetical protein G7Y79_00020g048550 [Physcia stellaris]
MSGAELVLAILPLLISAAEHWDDCIRPFKRYRRFAKEVDRFQQNLKVQYTIFRNQCRILLENVTQESTTVHDALSESNHPLWSDFEVEQQLEQYLAESRDACVAAIQLIEERLEKVQEESAGLGLIIAHDHENIRLGDKAWRQRVSKKLLFSFSKSRLDDTLSTLRSLNDDFRTLSSQTAVTHTATSSSKIPTRHNDKEVQLCRTIGKASCQVYEALGKACTKHTEHLAHFNLKVEHETRRDATTPELRFNMAFTHLTLTGLSQGEAIWFGVDTRFEDSAAPNGVDDLPKLEQLTGSLKRQTSSPEDCVKNRSKKRVRFQNQIPVDGVLSSPLSSPLLSVPFIRRDFCDHLRSLIDQHSCKPGACMALLDAREGCKHLVYPLPVTVHHRSRQALSLEAYIASISSNKGLFAFPQYERLQLAKALATAVLQYHGTPWLKLTWRSQDVVFFGQQKDLSNRDIPNFSSPHLNVKVRGPNGQDSQAVCHSRHLAPNSVLFGLGVMLLEIAYSATLQSLQQPCDLVNGIENEFTEFFTSKRLANSIGREMGSSYSKIVKKLLQCDFGCGDDLNEPELQVSYYKEVVCELDRLEQGFRDLQIGT